MKYHMEVLVREDRALGTLVWRPYLVWAADLDAAGHAACEAARNERFIGAGGFETCFEAHGVRERRGT